MSDNSRCRAKRTLVWLLYRQGWERQRVLGLFGILDWMMRLTPALEEQLWQDIYTLEGEIKMPYVTSVVSVQPPSPQPFPARGSE